MNLVSQFNRLPILYQTHHLKNIVSKLQLTLDIYSIANISNQDHLSKVMRMFKIKDQFCLWFHQRVWKVCGVPSSKLLIKNLVMIFGFIRMILIILNLNYFNCNKTNLYLSMNLPLNQSQNQSLKIQIFKRKRVFPKVFKTI